MGTEFIKFLWIEEEQQGSEKLKKRGRGVTINAKLASKRAKGKQLDVKFPPPFGKVCGKHAKLFKSEVIECIRQLAPLKFDNWNKIPQDDIKTMWRFLKDKFNLCEDDYDYAMRQVRRQYQVRLFNLYKAYREKKGRPNHVDPEDWKWLIQNKWNTKKFKDMSNRNKLNRSKQEMKSIVGTKSIVQKAYEMKNPETNEWPDAMEVWKATRMRSDETWSTPNDESILEGLKEIGTLYNDQISEAPVPLVEHFAIVLGRKKNHSRGVGVGAISGSFTEKQRIQAQVDAERRRAQTLQEEVEILTELSKKQEVAYNELQTQLNSQRAEMEMQRKSLETQNTEVQQKIQDEVQRQVSLIFASIASGKSLINLQSTAHDNGAQ